MRALSKPNNPYKDALLDKFGYTHQVSFNNYKKFYYDKKSSDFIWVPIYKNATNWIRLTLLSRGFTKKTLDKSENYYPIEKNALIVLRDPVNRWISGAAEYFYHLANNQVGNIPTNYIDSDVLSIILNRVELDMHTSKQSDYIKKIKLDKIIFFNFHENLSENFNKFLLSKNIKGSKHFTNVQDRPIVNSIQDSHPNKIVWYNFFNDVLKKPEYYKKVRDFYQDDYNLINSVKFYQ